jgi:hypothetical protein
VGWPLWRPSCAHYWSLGWRLTDYGRFQHRPIGSPVSKIHPVPNILDSFNLHQHVSSPTRVTLKSSTLIDHSWWSSLKVWRLDIWRGYCRLISTRFKDIPIPSRRENIGRQQWKTKNHAIYERNLVKIFSGRFYSKKLFNFRKQNILNSN